jgi:hypothetical protein
MIERKHAAMHPHEAKEIQAGKNRISNNGGAGLYDHSTPDLRRTDAMSAKLMCSFV